MRLQNNHSQNSALKFGMAIQFNKKTMEQVPEFIKLINDNAEIVNALTPNNDVAGIFNKKQNCVYLLKLDSTKIIKSAINIFILSLKASFAEVIGKSELMPNKAESLRLPSTSNALINALKKITK